LQVLWVIILDASSEVIKERETCSQGNNVGLRVRDAPIPDKVV
jgi:hypothetical protein